MRRPVALVTALLLLAGCTAAPLDTEPAPAVRVDQALVAQREAAGIADCPVTPATAQPVVGGLPDVLLGCLGSGRQVNLAALRGRPMVINAWAQWCGPCRLEAPMLAEFSREAGDDVLVIGLDYADPEPALALEFAQRSGWAYPHVTDPLKQTAAPLRMGGIPTTFFVDADGRIVYRHVGPFASTDQLRTLARERLGVGA